MVTDHTVSPTTRGRVLSMTCLAFGSVLAIYLTIIFQLMPGWTPAKAVAVGATTSLFGLWYLARRGQHYTAVARSFVAISLTTIFLAAIGNGGVDGYVTPLLIVGPLAAGYFLSVRSAIVCGVLALASLTGLYGLDQAGLVTETPYSEDATQIASLLLLSTATILSLTCALAFAIATERMLGEARKADAAKSAFLANMSHEIRTPMNGVIGVLDLLLHASTNAKERDLLLTASASSHALVSILDDILDHAKLEAGAISIETLPTDPRQSCQEVLDLFRAKADLQGLDLRLLVDDQVPTAVRTDPTRLRQILWNLIGNAVKFTDSGSIEIAIFHEQRHTPHRLRVEIRDTGVGMSEAARRTVFDRFAQADGSTTRRFGGTGLGLTICQKLIDLMDGEIGVSSTLGEGSTFWFSIDAPQCQPTPASSKIDKAVGEPERSLFILVVDDQLTNRMVIKALLEHFGHECLMAENGQAALDAVQQASFDAVFMDIHMPGMDGLETTRAIRNLGESYADLPVIAVTASAMRDETKAYADAGMGGCLAKPVNLEALAQTLRELTNGPVKPAGDKSAAA
jgi:signal transduction histidine kinase/CheY-like chemotaxis protein